MSNLFNRQQSTDLETLREGSQLLQGLDETASGYGAAAADADSDDESGDNNSTMTGMTGATGYRSFADDTSFVGTIVGTIADGVSSVAGDIMDVAVDVKESIVGEIIEVKEAFIDELHEADEGDDFFLEMALTRHFSILPQDVVEAAAATETDIEHSDSATHDADDEESTMLGKGGGSAAKQSMIPVSAYLLLASAVISLSSIGPFLDLQDNVGALMKMYWRMSATAMVLSPFAVYAMVYKNGLPRMTTAQWVTFCLASASYTVLCNGFVLALDYTTVGNAVILSNSQALLLLIGKASVGDPVQFLEGLGAIVAFGGALLCSKDSNDSSAAAAAAAAAASDAVVAVASSSNSTLYGDLLAIASALGGVGYLIFAKTIRPHMHLFVFMFLTMFAASTFTAILIILTELPFSFDRHVSTGFFGWMNLEFDRLPLEMTTVVICNLMGTMGYVRAMKDFDNLIISVAALMEPVVASFIAYALHVGSLPGLYGWIGNALVGLGTFGVVYPTATAKNK